MTRTLRCGVSLMRRIEIVCSKNQELLWRSVQHLARGLADDDIVLYPDAPQMGDVDARLDRHDVPGDEKRGAHDGDPRLLVDLQSDAVPEGMAEELVVSFLPDDAARDRVEFLPPNAALRRVD